MNEQQETAGEKTLTQIFGEAKRSRHDRETLAILGKCENISRDTMRKIEKVDKTAPAIISKAMGKEISIHKAYEINKYLQQMPEDEREALAVWLICKELEDRVSGAYKEKRIAKKLFDVMSIAKRYDKYLTEEVVDFYLKHNFKSLADCVDMINDEICQLSKLKLIIQKRRLTEQEK